MVKVKICGITDVREIEYLNDLKPDYAGFVFAESKRKVNAEEAGKLRLNLSNDIKRVGVFRNQLITDVKEILKNVDLDVIQLHGNEDIEYIKKLRNYVKDHVEIWKAVTINELKDMNKISNKSAGSLIDKYLVDGIKPGSGQSYSLKSLNDYIRYIPYEFKFFLAGGITPDNVIDKINEVNPFGIDVSSGVEYVDEFGNRIKSYEKIKQLIKNVRSLTK